MILSMFESQSTDTIWFVQPVKVPLAVTVPLAVAQGDRPPIRQSLHT
jgi:hypothetical protein